MDFEALKEAFGAGGLRARNLFIERAAFAHESEGKEGLHVYVKAFHFLPENDQLGVVEWLLAAVVPVLEEKGPGR